MTSDTAASAAILFEGDAYDVTLPRLLGRQAAGHGFLRAAVAAAQGAPLIGYGQPGSADAFADLVHGIDATARTAWVRADDLDGLSRAGVTFRPDPIIGQAARLRLRGGIARYCITGVTHTTATQGAMGELANLLHDPLAPWDAVICTSNAVAETLRRVHEAEADYLRWRFGPDARISGPQLPVIPLGVHCDDFNATADSRAQARRTLGLADDEVAALFVGRLDFGSKAHPLPMFRALQAATEQTGRRVTLIQCGWFENAKTQAAYVDTARTWCPDVKQVLVDGRDRDARRAAWAAGDLFVSLSDNIQETFGLTPVEAMAAGLPVVVTDWNGYKDTVRDGVDGFRICTWAPEPGILEHVARGYEAGTIHYGQYCWAGVTASPLDQRQLTDRLAALVGDAGLRRRLGAAGQARARERFDWAQVYRDYQTLWAELDARRRSVLERDDEVAWVTSAPKVAARSLDPFDAFASYPSHSISRDTVLTLCAGASLDHARQLAAHPVFIASFTGAEPIEAIWRILSDGPAPIGHVMSWTGLSARVAILAAATLAKMGLIRLD